MARLLAFMLGAAALGYAAYAYVSGQPSSDPHALSAPARTLDSTRQTAKEIEKDAQQRADDLLEKTK